MVLDGKLFRDNRPAPPFNQSYSLNDFHFGIDVIPDETRMPKFQQASHDDRYRNRHALYLLALPFVACGEWLAQAEFTIGFHAGDSPVPFLETLGPDHIVQHRNRLPSDLRPSQKAHVHDSHSSCRRGCTSYKTWLRIPRIIREEAGRCPLIRNDFAGITATEPNNS